MAGSVSTEPRKREWFAWRVAAVRGDWSCLVAMGPRAVGGGDGSVGDVGSLEAAARMGAAAGQPIDAGTADDDRGAGLRERGRHPRAQHALARVGGWDGSVPGFRGRGRFRGGAGVGGVCDLRRWAEAVGIGRDEAGRCAQGGRPGSARCEHAPVAGDGWRRRDQLSTMPIGRRRGSW